MTAEFEDKTANALLDALVWVAENRKRLRRADTRRTNPTLYLHFYTRMALARIRNPFARKTVLELADALDWALHGALPKGADGRRPGTYIETTADLLAPLAARYRDDLGRLGRDQSVETLKRSYLKEARAFLKAKGKLLRVKRVMGKKVEVSERTLRQALFGGTSSSAAMKRPGG